MIAFVFTSCQKDNEVASHTGTNVQAGEIDIDDEKPITGIGYEDEIRAHVDQHGVNLDMMEEMDVTRPDGSVDRVYMVGGDIELTRVQLQELRTTPPGRQYSTNNLVSNNQTITVTGLSGYGGGYDLSSRMRTGLQWAINNYNALNIGLSFSLSYSSNLNADIVVYRNPGNSGAGGSAGFPSGGNPYKWVQIYTGMQSYSNNVNEHVIGHEIGHAIGLRHTDYFSRQSCGQNVNEGSAGVGANLIPGTPSGYDPNSLMLACFNSGEDGEFGFYDRVALEYLY
ncbi:MAG: M57 family metalloprotease [Bacteroidota bacterium]